MTVVDRVEIHEFEFEVHACGAGRRHIMAALGNGNFYGLALVHPKCANPLPPVHACDYSDALEVVGDDGCVPVPSDPGLGVTTNWDNIERQRTALHNFS